MDLTRRNLQQEIMDAPDISAARLEGALRGLERINFFSGSARRLWREIENRAKHADRAGAPLRVLDIATGAGDTPIGLARYARRAGIRITIEACDRNSDAVCFAQSKSNKAQLSLRFFQSDFFAAAPEGEYDVIMCSLFLHHLESAQAQQLLTWMCGHARRMVLIDDLIRSPAGYWMAWFGTRLLSRSEVVHVDGPRSVEGAFSVDEARALAQASGMEGYSIRRHWPFRFLLRWEADR